MSHVLTRDGWLLFSTRALRMFAYGCLSIVLVLYLTAQGLTEKKIGLLLTVALLGDIVVSLWITTAADRLGRKHMLMLGAALMALAGAVFAATNEYVLLLIVAAVGVLSPSDKEVGPFLSIEQAALSQTVPDAKRTKIFAWYHLTGSLMAALGALAVGKLCERLTDSGATGANVYRPVVIAYAVAGVVLSLCFMRLSAAAESPAKPHESLHATWMGLHQSKPIVLRLSALFALDAFAGGFILQSMLAYWFYLRFTVDLTTLGTMFFAANLFAAASALAAAALARRFGLINTMVWTHLPSNVLLILIPLSPNLTIAVTLLLIRFAISQMDVPTRQSYTMAVVSPDERSAAAGITTVARSMGAAVAPAIAGYLLADPRFVDWPLYLAGGIKIIYDLLLYRAFKNLKPAEEIEGLS